MRLLSLLILAFVIVLGISFAVLNAESVVVHYYVGSKTIPLPILILGVLVTGLIMGYCASLLSILKLKLEMKRLQRPRD